MPPNYTAKYYQVCAKLWTAHKLIQIMFIFSCVAKLLFQKANVSSEIWKLFLRSKLYRVGLVGHTI